MFCTRFFVTLHRLNGRRESILDAAMRYSNICCIIMQIAIVKYDAGNIFSVVNALRRLGIEPLLTNDREQLLKADGVLFPGQGEAASCMRSLKSNGLDEVIKDLKQPVLGICVGQQLLCRHSEEGDTDCIGVFDVDVHRFRPTRHEDKVPCMGWNNISLTPDHSLTPNLSPQSEGNIERRGGSLTAQEVFTEGLFFGLQTPYVYFVHSYYVPVCEWTSAVANYILPYSAALQKDNFYTCQFHPEKSGMVGEQIIKNFLDIVKG